jgi:hypothetical protein
VVSDGVLGLDGGNEDNDLWYRHGALEDGTHIFESVWVPDDEERLAIANGANIELNVLGPGHPPVFLAVTGVELGRPHE